MAYPFIKNKFPPSVFSLFFFLIFMSCNIGVDLRENENLTFNAMVKTSGSPELETALRSVLNMVHAESIFDEEAIGYKLKQWDTRDVYVKSPSLCTLQASFNTENPEDLLPKKSSLISRDKKTTTIKLDEITVNHCLEMLPDDSLTVIDLLSAPIFTREDLSEDEYLENISVLYGANITSFLKTANLTLSFESQSPITKASSSIENFAVVNRKGKKVTFIIPLVKLLCLRETLLLSITQK